MSRYTGAVCKLCRREGSKLFLKGDKCFTKCVVEKRKQIPGQHGKSHRPGKASEYQKRLREKQKLKRMAGLTERPFRNYFEQASNQKGLTGENLLKLLETRLDHVVHRLGFSSSTAGARQMVLHRHITVNGKAVSIPSYALKPGDILTLKPSEHNNAFYKRWWENSAKNSTVPSWLERDNAQFSGSIKSWPSREEMSFPVNEQLIVELYSK